MDRNDIPGTGRERGGHHMPFDYFYGTEREYFRYYQMPAVMLEDGHYQKLSANAKLLYSVLLNLVSLSQANDWIERGTNRVYIICPQKEIAYRLGCSLRSTVKIVKELEEFGLLERKKQGQGRPELLFVKNFASGDIGREIKGFNGQRPYCRETGYGPDEYKEEESFTEQGLEQKEDSVVFPDMQKLHVRTCRNCTFRHAEIARSDMQKLHVKTCKSCTSRHAEAARLDMQKLHANYIYNNKPDGIISNQSINPEEETCAVEHGAGSSLPKVQEDGQRIWDWDAQDIPSCRAWVRRQIEYDVLVHDLPHDRESVDGLVELLAELLASRKETIRISGEELDAQSVKERFQRIDLSCMRYILACLRENSRKVHNIRQYLIATMYNAPVTIRHFYQSEANHGVYAGEG